MYGNSSSKGALSLLVTGLCLALAAPAFADEKLVSVGLDETQSTVGFAASRESVEHVRHFARLSGTVTLAKGEPVALDVRVDMSSLVGGKDELGRDLASSRFFDIAKFPLSKFQTTKIVRVSGADATHEVTGYLEVRGKRVKVVFPATIERKKGELRGEAVITLNRRDFGITADGPGGERIRDHLYLAVVIVCDAPK
jgi:polyisoprenoid-binding protein YceI